MKPTKLIYNQSTCSIVSEPVTAPEVKLTYLNDVPMESRVKITSSQDAQKVFTPLFADRIGHLEMMCAAFVDRANTVCGVMVLSIGGVTGCLCDPKVLFQAAILCNASGILLAHNHPSGNLNASMADKEITKRIKDGARLLDMQLLDHLILTPDGRHYSFANDGML